MKEELANLARTFEALGPIVGHAVKSGQLFKPRCELTEPNPDILCEYDVRIPMSEGFSVTANIYYKALRRFGKPATSPENKKKVRRAPKQ